MPKSTARPFKGFIPSDDSDAVRRQKSRADGLVRLSWVRYEQDFRNVSLLSRLRIADLWSRVRKGEPVLDEARAREKQFNESKAALDKAIAGQLDGSGGGPGFFKRGNFQHYSADEIAKMALKLREKHEAVKGTKPWIKHAHVVNFEFRKTVDDKEIFPVGFNKAIQDLSKGERKQLDRFHLRLREFVLPQLDAFGDFDKDRKLLPQ